MIKKFLKNKSGNVILSIALLAAPLMAGVGIAVDYSRLRNAEAKLQNAVDSAALASAKELRLSNTDQKIVSEVAKNYIVENLALSLSRQDIENHIQVGTNFAPNNTGLRVDLAYFWTPMLLHYINKEALPLRVSAEANLAGNVSVCMIGLEPSKDRTIFLTKSAKLEAPDCGVFSNSTHEDSIYVRNDASIKSGMTCSSGGIRTRKRSSVVPDPITDCPEIPDPLLNRTPPTVGPCDFKRFKIDSGNHLLLPGTYCGGLRIRGDAKVHLTPGVYIMKNGKLQVTDNATLEGKNVGFYFTGNNAKLQLQKQTTINLTAPEKGVMAGILMFEDRGAPDIERHQITSDNARMLLGTIYLPNGTLQIDSEAPIADKAAYTAIIARSIKLFEGPTLYLNSDYEATNVPVPEGLIGDRVVLAK